MLAGAWLGGVVFTTFVVSPTLKAMKWPEPERVLMRSTTIGKQYAKVGSANLVLLLLSALLDGLAVGSEPPTTESTRSSVAFGLVAAYGAYFRRRLANVCARVGRGRSTPRRAGCSM